MFIFISIFSYYLSNIFIYIFSYYLSKQKGMKLVFAAKHVSVILRSKSWDWVAHY
jgi:hypothetical protein